MSTKTRPNPKGLGPRAKSVSSKPPVPQTRTHRVTTNNRPKPLASTSAIYKTNSDTSLSNAVHKLNLNDKTGSAASSTKTVRAPSRRVGSSGSGCRNLQDVAQKILDQKAKNIVVMVGAGISTPSGIPDFRTPGTGLYDNIKQYKIPYPEAIFDIEYFESYPKPFFSLAKELYPNGQYNPNLIHYFLRLLNEKGVLMRIYTQNIDGLERSAGIPAEKLVEAHGNFLTVSCIRCKKKHDTEKIQTAIFAERLPRCMLNGCTGLVKPDIVFFGEDLPRRFYYYLRDFPQADMLLVMGTSLEVEPFAGIIDSVRYYTPRVLFNRNVVGPFHNKKRMSDVVALGDIIQQLKKLVELLGWEEDLQALLADSKTEQGSDKEKALLNTEQAPTTAENPPHSTLKEDHSSNMNKDNPKKTKNSNLAVLSKRPSLTNGLSARKGADLTAFKQIIRTNGLNSRQKQLNKPTTRVTPPQNGPNPSLPRIGGHRPIAFHIQKTMYRTNNPRLMKEASSEESSSDSGSDDD